MKVAQYTFQSPSTSSVQVGRLIPSSVEKDKGQSQAQKSSAPAVASTAKTPEQWLKSDAVQTQKVKPAVTTDNGIDTYA